MPGNIQIAGVILAGGKSRRMGRDKASLRLGRKTFLGLAVERIRPLVAEVFIGGGGKRYPGTRYLSDRIRKAGPLIGLYTALTASSYPYVLLLGVDLPFVSRELLRSLIRHRREALVVIPKTKQGLEPLCAVYSRKCLPQVEELIQNKSFAMKVLLDRIAVREVPLSEAGVDEEELWNVNTSEAYNQAKALWRGKEGKDR